MTPILFGLVSARAKFGLAVPLKCLLFVGTNECTKRRHRTKMIRLQDPLRAMSPDHFRRGPGQMPYKFPIRLCSAQIKPELTGKLKFLS